MTDQQLLEAIATELGRVYAEMSAVEQAQLSLWLGDVSSELDGRIDSTGIIPDSATLDRVRRLAVVARASRPDFGVVATEVGVDDARVVTRYERGNSASLIAPEWWVWLGLDISGGAFSIVPAYSDGSGGWL